MGVLDSLQSALDKWDKLNPSEKWAVASYPVLASVVPAAASNAFAETKARFGKQGHNDSSDAFRHCYWSSLITRDAGVLAALSFTTAHEDNPNNPPDEKDMDLHNNSVGIAISIGHTKKTSDKILSDACFKALQEGRLKVIKP